MKVAIVMFDGVQALDVAGPSTCPPKQTRSFPTIRKVHRYVTGHMTGALSIEQLAGAVAVSRRTFSRLFAKYAKVTPPVFVEQVRVDSAEKLLEDTDAPLKTVAFKCGLRSATHMRTTSPGGWRSHPNNTGNDSAATQTPFEDWLLWRPEPGV